MIMVNTLGILLIGLIVWWFWLYQPKSVAVGSDEVVIHVGNGVYDPSRLQVPAHQPLRITFMRHDSSPCSETVVFPELDISTALAHEEPTIVELPPLAPGDYNFHCQMEMYQGSLKVSEESS